MEADIEAGSFLLIDSIFLVYKTSTSNSVFDGDIFLKNWSTHDIITHPLITFVDTTKHYIS